MLFDWCEKSSLWIYPTSKRASLSVIWIYLDISGYPQTSIPKGNQPHLENANLYLGTKAAPWAIEFIRWMSRTNLGETPRDLGLPDNLDSRGGAAGCICALRLRNGWFFGGEHESTNAGGETRLSHVELYESCFELHVLRSYVSIYYSYVSHVHGKEIWKNEIFQGSPSCQWVKHQTLLSISKHSPTSSSIIHQHLLKTPPPFMVFIRRFSTWSFQLGQMDWAQDICFWSKRLKSLCNTEVLSRNLAEGSIWTASRDKQVMMLWNDAWNKLTCYWNRWSLELSSA